MRRTRLIGLIGLAASFVWCGGSGGKAELGILLRMMPAQERFLREEIIPEFEREHDCRVKVSVFEKQWDIDRVLKLERSKRHPEIDLVKTPFEMTRVLVSHGYMEELTNVRDSSEVVKDFERYHQLASGLGFVEGKPYYVPRKLETRILFYRKSMVADAVEKFEGYRSDIEEALEKVNGYGLPSDYVLENEPGQWDLYDVYVVGFVWAHEEYQGVRMGRLAHRGARYGGTALFLVDRAIQLGASPSEVLDISCDASAETFLWEKVLVDGGLYHSGMWQDAWKGAGIYNGIKDGKVFLAYLQQIDCFNVHGWSDDPGMPGYLPDRDDMGLSIVPRAVSLGLDSSGNPRRAGGRSISTGGWWWGIPKTAVEKDLAYEFARFMTSREVQVRESSKFGLIPVRRDVLTTLPNVFDEGWVGDIFLTSVDQIRINGLTTVPLVPEYSQASRLYVDAWYAICLEPGETKEGIPEFGDMKRRLVTEFPQRRQAILGEETEDR